MQKINSRILFIGYALVIVLFFLVHIVLGSVKTVVFINSWHSPFLDSFFASITNLGSGLVVLPFLLISLFQRFYISIALTINVLLQGVLVSLFKRLLFHDAPRPINFLDDCIIHRVEGVNIHRIMSFPSGHAVTIFGLCFFLSLYAKSNRVLVLFLLFIAIVVGLSRIYLLQHFALDVAVGALLGVGCATWAFYYFEKIAKPDWMQGYFEIRLKSKAPKKEPRFN